MKNILRLFFAASIAILLSVSAIAQTPEPLFMQDDAPESLTYRNGKLYADDVLLSDDTVRRYFGYELYRQTYQGAVRQYKAGTILSIVGSGVFACGIGLLIGGAIDGDDVLVYSGSAVGSLGEMTLGAGITFYCIGKYRLKWLTEEYGERRKASRATLSFGPTGNGIGLAFRF